MNAVTLSPDQMSELKLFLKNELQSLFSTQTSRPAPDKYAISRSEMVKILGRTRYYECKEAGLIPFICDENKKGKHEANRKLFFEMLENLNGFKEISNQMQKLM